MESFWVQVADNSLRQGDFLNDCVVPVVPKDFHKNIGDLTEVPTQLLDLIIITQSCDLVNEKASMVAMCPVYSLPIFEETNPGFKGKKWNRVRLGRVEGLHLLASPTAPEENRQALVVDFRQIHSLPIEYLNNHALEQKGRWRLRSPFLEHFSQAFARFFMRVGLPSGVPEF